MKKHTPGPWVMMTRPEIDCDRIDANTLVGGYTGRDEYDQEMGVVSYECLRTAGEYDPEPICRPCSEADARLIAASPELLDSLVDCLAIVRIQNGNLNPDIYEIIKRAEAAIAKATGQCKEPCS